MEGGSTAGGGRSASSAAVSSALVVCPSVFRGLLCPLEVFLEALSVLHDACVMELSAKIVGAHFSLKFGLQRIEAAPRRARHPAHGPQDLGQALRADDQKEHERNDQQLREADIEHGEGRFA